MLDTALKEWAIVCDLLLEGRLALLLRKGGIHEDKGPGVFELEYPRFGLFPSWAHQKPLMIKEPVRDRVQVLDEPDEITFHGIGEAAKIWRITDRAAFETLDHLHCWTRPHIDMRFNYKPENPLYLIAVHASRLRTPKTVKNHAQYTGCKSWVPLRAGDEIDDAGAAPVLTDAQFEAIVSEVDAALNRPSKR